jgi:hypothetical protein
MFTTNKKHFLYRKGATGAKISQRFFAITLRQGGHCGKKKPSHFETAFLKS